MDFQSNWFTETKLEAKKKEFFGTFSRKLEIRSSDALTVIECFYF